MTSLPSNLESERKALVKRVWDQCWEEFHSWKTKFASEEIAAAAVGRSAALQVKLEQDSQPDVAPPATGRNRFEINDGLNEVPLSSGNQLLTVWSFPVAAAGESGDIVPTGHRIPVYPCDPIKDISKPVAPYESCVLLSQNVQFTDTAAEFEVMEFMPFGNEAAFRRKNPDFLKDEETGGKRFTFKWDMPDRDPDVDVVMCEAARRLHTDHGLSFAEIDSAEVLPRSLVMDDGSIWNPFILRTVLPWPAQRLFDTRPKFKELSQSITNLSTEQRLLRIANLMCANLGCIQPACPTHGLGSQPSPKRIRPTITQMVEACEEPCGPDCFQTRDRQSSGLILWSDTELHELGDVWDSWNAGSGLSVCKLSRMVFKPCWEVFEKLHAVQGPFDLLDTQESGGSSSDHQVYEDTKKRLRFDAHRRGNDYEYHPPCNHAGPCQAGSDCVCYRAQLRCKRNCTCNTSCRRRWKGCSCSQRTGACWTNSCLCVRNMRECDPELCQTCGAQTGSPCRNVEIRLGRKKRTKVVMRDYEWGPGWGLELAEPATKEEFIDEYVGEVIGEIEADFRSLEAEYLDRNYMFGLDKARSIDSARASNETRVINHARDKKENLVAEVRFVDEEPRIAFFAGRRIEPGEELFFNYGQEFFGKSRASGSRGKKK